MKSTVRQMQTVKNMELTEKSFEDLYVERVSGQCNRFTDNLLLRLKTFPEIKLATLRIVEQRFAIAGA